MNVARSVVHGRVGKCKTEVSCQPVPLDQFTADEIWKWRQECTYGTATDWIFASDWTEGRMPPWANTLLTRFLEPAIKVAKTKKRVGWHTFRRHTYSTLLKGCGEDVKVVQELMRHASFQATMNVYTRAITTAKRDAQTRVVNVLMDRTARVKEGSVETAAQNQRTFEVSRFCFVFYKLLIISVGAAGFERVTSTVGGGTQERLGLYLKSHLTYLPAIHCIGAAIAFLSGDQVHMPEWADRFYLGWLFRCLSSPQRYVPRYWSAMQFVPLLWRYRSRLPTPAGELDHGNWITHRRGY